MQLDMYKEIWSSVVSMVLFSLNQDNCTQIAFSEESA